MTAFQPFTEAEGKASLEAQKRLADARGISRGMIEAPIDSEALLAYLHRRRDDFAADLADDARDLLSPTQRAMSGARVALLNELLHRFDPNYEGRLR